MQQRVCWAEGKATMRQKNAIAMVAPTPPDACLALYSSALALCVYRRYLQAFSIHVGQ